MAKKKVAPKRPVKKIPQPKFPPNWGKVTAVCSSPIVRDWEAVVMNASAVGRPIKDTAADIQHLVVRVDALVTRWSDLTAEVETLVAWVVKNAKRCQNGR